MATTYYEISDGMINDNLFPFTNKHICNETDLAKN